MEKIGLIVGNGKLPLYFIEEAKNSNISVYPIGLFPSVDEEIKKSDNYAEFNVGHIGEIIKYLLLNDITKIVMLGKIEKKLIFENLILDKYGEKIMEIVPDKKDETLLFAIIGFLRLNGIKVLPQSYFFKINLDLNLVISSDGFNFNISSESLLELGPIIEFSRLFPFLSALSGAPPAHISGSCNHTLPCRSFITCVPSSSRFYSWVISKIPNSFLQAF